MKYLKIVILLLIICYNIINCSEITESSDIYLGIIEQNFNDWKIDKNNPFIVRIIFKKKKTWESLIQECSNINKYLELYPKKVIWTICFDSKNIGNIKTVLPQQIDNYADIGIHFIENLNEVPKIGKPSMHFAGWIQKPVYRPLIVNSKNFYQDPEKWKSFIPTENDLKKVLETAKNLSLQKDSININKYKVNRSYKSISNHKLISINFENNQNAEMKTGIYLDVWFYIYDTNCEYLNSDMILIDAGDYDNDGKSEVIFKFSGYNQAGYIMFFNSFKNSINFLWNFH